MKKITSIMLTALFTASALLSPLPGKADVKAMDNSISLTEEFLTDTIDTYNIKWDSQSTKSIDSIPVGGHSVGVNVWVENNDILFYIGKSDAFDENGQLLKLGRVRLKLTPNPFKNADNFSQELKLKEGYCTITAGDVTIDIWCETDKSAVHVDIDSKTKIDVEAIYETWRYEDRFQTTAYRVPAAATAFWGYANGMTTYKDTVNFRNNGIEFYHRNKNDKLYFDIITEQQGLTHLEDKMTNPIKNLTFGGFMKGNNMAPTENVTSGRYADSNYKGWSIKTKEPTNTENISVYLNTSQAETISGWQNEIDSSLAYTETNRDAVRQSVLDFWDEFWLRSFISVNTEEADVDDEGWQVGRNYNLFRYMMGCNEKGAYPTKFNGGIFTTDPTYVNSTHDTPDYRMWGGGDMTAQNQCRVYWPLLKSGDFDMMISEFNFYDNSLTNMELATKDFFGHDGCGFAEYPSLFGLASPYIYGWTDPNATSRQRDASLPRGEISAQYVRYQYNHQLEFSKMILEYHKFSGADISRYIDFIESSLTFYKEHYSIDKDGELYLYPSTALETYKNTTNPTDVIAALNSVIDSLLEVSDEYEVDTEKWIAMKATLPDMSYTTKGGKRVLSPGEVVTESPINVEIPELYPVYPYDIIDVESDLYQVAIDTWNQTSPSLKGHISWHQDGIWTARLGLTSEAKSINIKKLADSGRRFPAYFGPGNDWTPDFNWGATGMNGLQEMLLQTTDETMLSLCHAWPSEWNASFKLHAPFNTTVEGDVEYGKLKKAIINVDSESSRSEVKFMYTDVANATVTNLSGENIPVNKINDTAILFEVTPGESYVVENLGSLPKSKEIEYFFDDFESSNDNWTVGGYGDLQMNYSEDFAHSGNTSYKVDADFEYISHTFPTELKKTVSVWFYDSLAPAQRSFIFCDTGDRKVGMGIIGSTSKSVYCYRVGSGFTKTNVARTEGWHEAKFDYNKSDCKMYIDGNLVATAEGRSSFTQIALGDFWGDNLGTPPLYFDSVSVYDKNIELYLENYTREDTDTSISVTCDALNISGGDKEVTLICAFYDEYGSLTSVSTSETKAVKLFDSVPFTLKAPTTSIKDGKLTPKLFWWDKKTLIPFKTKVI